MARRKTEFSRALAAAKAELNTKRRQRDRAVIDLAKLNLDIPNLERTVKALSAQLQAPLMTKTQRDVLEEKYYRPVLENNPELKVIAEIPPDIRAQLPKDDLSGMASHFGDGPAPQEDFLPEITGKDPLEKK